MTPPSRPSILLIGCGHMGGAMFRGWLSRGISPSVVVDHAETIPYVNAPHRLVHHLGDIPTDFEPDVVVLAVKPNQLKDVAGGLEPFVGNAVVLSVLVGVTTDTLESHFGNKTACVRCMPNTPSAVGEGMTAMYASHRVTKEQKQLCTELLDAIGETAWIEDESLMDAVSAISGSGPAYVFLLAELMEKIGQEMGLPADIARRLARKTVSGSGALLAASETTESAELRRQITSPGGTTQQALAVMMHENAWPKTIREALAAAVRRAREISQGS